MVEVAVNKDGSEVIGEYLFRAKGSGYDLTDAYSKDDGEFWMSLYNDPDDGWRNIAIKLPKGTIKKLIGRELTWEDEPVELK